MAHKKLDDGRFVVDWETGDPQGDRKYLFQAYSDFIKELLYEINGSHNTCAEQAHDAIANVIERWGVSIDGQVDDFPRIWIKRPE